MHKKVKKYILLLKYAVFLRKNVGKIFFLKKNLHFVKKLYIL